LYVSLTQTEQRRVEVLEEETLQEFFAASHPDFLVEVLEVVLNGVTFGRG
jgi:hypothetical protein